MNKPTDPETDTEVIKEPTPKEDPLTLRTPFKPHQISKLPKPTKKQTDEVKADYKKGIRCEECGGWHHRDVIHLDYVGHAALTDRLLDVDPEWYWEPLATYENGAPAFDEIGGLWIKLYVNGMGRIGYGSADGKSGGDAKKEVIGDALRNAAMRFGAALDLWHKGNLHEDEPKSSTDVVETAYTKTKLKEAIHDICQTINTMKPEDGEDYLKAYWEDNKPILKQAYDQQRPLYDSVVASAKAAKTRFKRADNQGCPI